MRLTRNRDTEQSLFEKFRAHLTRDPRTGVHVSDLISPLLTYWKRTKPLPLTEDECLYFLGGIAHHAMVEAAVEGGLEKSFVDEETGVTYSPDLNSINGEIKTTRSDKVPSSEAEAKRKFAEYIKQCRMYAALKRVSMWTLIVNYHSVAEQVSQYYTAKRPKLRAYDLTFTGKELQRERQQILALSTELTRALVEQDPSRLPLCAAWKCYELIDGKKVGKCRWWEECQPEGRYADGKRDTGFED